MSDSAGAQPESVAPAALPPEKPALSLGLSPTTREPERAPGSSGAHGGHGQAHRPKYVAKLAIAALGVVFGDIGTSPLYSMRECFHAEHGMPITRESVLGILSLIFWSLMLIVAIKYVFY